MRHIGSSLLAATLLLGAPSARPADTWVRLASPHFELAGNVSEGELKRVALKFESFRNVLEQVLSASPSSDKPPRVFVFKDRRSYEPYLPVIDGKPVQVGGYFLPGHARPYITLTLVPWADDPYTVVFHEYVHLVNSKSHGPAWFSEGYAEFLAGCVIDGDKASLGRPNLSHIQILRTRTPFPLLTLMSMRVPAHDVQAQHLFYAQSWLLVHYLLIERNQGRAQMIGFLNTAGTGGVNEAAFHQAFGIGSEQMGRDLRRYAESLTMGFFKVSIAKSALPRDPKPRRIEAAEAEALLADLVAQHPEREGEGRGRLERVLQQEPDLLVAREAIADLDRPPVRFLPGHGVVDEAQSRGMQELSVLATRVAQLVANDEFAPSSEAGELEAAVRAYIDRYPSNPEGFITLAHLRARRGAPPGETIDILTRAVAADPSGISPRLALSRAYRAWDDFDAARRVLKEGAGLAEDPGLAAVYAIELEALAPLHRVRGFLVNLRCDPGGRLDFAIETETGQSLNLRAATPTSFRVFRGGKSVEESLTCGTQRRPMIVTYKELQVQVAGIDGELSSFDIDPS